jgi:hypothetical protein
MKNLIEKYVGQKGHINLRGLQIEVEIEDVRQVWGKVQLQVHPIAGANSVWIELESFHY